MRSNAIPPVLLSCASLFASASLFVTGAAAAPPSWPVAKLPAVDARRVDPGQLLPEQQLREWQVDLDRRGLRATGSAAQEGYVAELGRRLHMAGVREVHFEGLRMRRWMAKHWSLEITDGAVARTMPTAAYVPYSGSTRADGVRAALAALPADSAQDRKLAGKIVLFEVPTVPLTVGYFMKRALFSYDPEHSMSEQMRYERPHNQIALVAATLRRIEAAGAVGAIAVLDAPAAVAHGAYYPYNGQLGQMPALFVDRDAGTRLKALADGATKVRLVLTAEVKEVWTHNLVGIISGASQELMLVNSHTDGTNGIEDNGPNAIVAIAQYLARLRRQDLPRSILILLTTGHFAGGNGAMDFLKRHRGAALLERIGAAVTLEHLGAQEWLTDAQGRLAPSGEPELTAIFTPQVPALIEASEAALRGADIVRSFVLPPLNPENKGTGAAVWPGEGQYFWGEGDIPTINYITGPSYLLHWGVMTADKVDYARMRREVIALTQMILDLSRVPLTDLR